MHVDDAYYLKALDNYPYYLEQTLEALQYGLSANPEHPGLLTLEGRIYANELKSPEQAIASFRAAIAYDPWHKQAYYELGMVLLDEKRIKRAEKIIEQAFERFGPSDRKFLYLKAYQREVEGRYEEAIELLEHAKVNCYDTSCYEHYCEEIVRIRQKCRRPLVVGGHRFFYEVK